MDSLRKNKKFWVKFVIEETLFHSPEGDRRDLSQIMKEDTRWMSDLELICISHREYI